MAAKQQRGHARQGKPAALNPRRRLDVGEFTSDPPDDYEENLNPLDGIGFTLDGERFECKGELDLLDKSELTMLAMSSLDTRSPEAVAMISQFLRLAFGPQEYLRFRAHVRSHRTPDDTQLAILAGISEVISEALQDATGRPTRPRSSSSAGPSETDDRVSRVISLGTGDVQIVDLDPPPGNGQTG
jgi:hypothetical protein